MRNKYLSFKRAMILVSAMLLCSFCTPSLAAGLFDGLLPTPTPTAAPTATPAPTPTPAPKPVSAEVPASLSELTQQLAQLYGEPAISQNGDHGTLSYSIPYSQIEELFAPQEMAALSKMTIDLEHSLLVLEYHSETEGPVQTSAASVPSAVVMNICGACGGLGTCNFCIGGDCEYCYGEGDSICTAGCIGGRCLACDDGKVLYDFDSKGNPKYRNCSSCYGGKCKECGGDGRVSCSYCGGTGNCNFCYGSGECGYCR